MAQGLTFDAGLFIAAEKRSRRFLAIWAESVARCAPRTVSVTVLAQVWRSEAAMVARVVKSCVIEGLSEERSKQIGLLLGAAGTSDIVDAAVVLGAVERRDAIATSDPEDISRLLFVLRARVPIIEV